MTLPHLIIIFFFCADVFVENKEGNNSCITWILMCLLLQGVRPESFAKLESKDIKEIIDGCTKTRKDVRSVHVHV